MERKPVIDQFCEADFRILAGDLLILSLYFPSDMFAIVRSSPRGDFFSGSRAWP
jgi:hypothetical protein